MREEERERGQCLCSRLAYGEPTFLTAKEEAKIFILLRREDLLYTFGEIFDNCSSNGCANPDSQRSFISILDY